MFSRRIATTAITALVCALLAASASAQLENLPPFPPEATDALRTAAEPGPYLKQQTGQDVDTDYTPIAKESPYFTLHQGAFYRDEGNGGAESEEQYRARREASATGASELVTHWDDELTDVAFTNTRNGFAGGQRKIDCLDAEGDPVSESNPGDGVPDTYVPVIYRHGDSPEGLRWLRPTEQAGGLFGDCSSPGFIGQIAWIRTTGMALAVGGDGSYPYREPAHSDTDPETGEPCNEPGVGGVTKPFGHNCDQTGLGRAWLYNHGRWTELDFDPEDFRSRPDPATDPDGEDARWGNTIHGMTAADFSELPTRNFGFVGALGQIRPFTVAVQGENGPCAGADPNECVKFPNQGELPVLKGLDGRIPTGRFDMDTRAGVDGLTDPAAQPDPVNDPPNTTNAWSNRQLGKPRGGDIDHAFRFRFRVRQLRMRRGSSGTANQQVGAVAVTTGCCAGATGGSVGGAGATENYPSLLLFDDEDASVGDLPSASGWRWMLYSADTYGQWYEPAAYYALGTEQRRALAPPNARADWPDSFFAVGFTFRTSPAAGSLVAVVAAPGGPAAQPERTALVSEPICFGGGAKDPINLGALGEVVNTLPDRTQPGQLFAALRAQLATARLVDGDGEELAGWVNPMRMGLFPFSPSGGPPYAGAPSESTRFTGAAGCRQGLASRTPGEYGYEQTRSDSVPDWAVGELRSTAVPGAGARGLAYSTVSRPELVPGVVDIGWSGDEERIAGATFPPAPDAARLLATLADPLNNPPTSQQRALAYLRSQHFFTGSYALNAIDFLDGTGSGWAVGARGGIVQLGGVEQSLTDGRAKPQPPALGARRSGQAPERAPYAALDPPPVAPGAVPSLGTRRLRRLAEPVLRVAGAPDAARDYGNGDNSLGQLVLSRDGAEGWGLARQKGAGGAMTLFHYRGGDWTRCDPEGIEGQLAPDPTCAALAPLRAYEVNAKPRGVNVVAAARIPYENDADATNDDEFEVLALGSGYPCQPACLSNGGAVTTAPTLLRYREGAWRVEEDPTAKATLADGLNFQSTIDSFYNPVSLAFASPSDGWALTARTAAGGLGGRLLHFNGERWQVCTTTLASPVNTPARAAACDDPDGQTISADPPVEAPEGVLGNNSQTTQHIDRFTGLASAGNRLFLFGSRSEGDPNQSYPLILCKQADGPWRNSGCGLDPGLAIRRGAAAGEQLTGSVSALAVTVDADGVLRGWATGSFSDGSQTTALLRLDRDGWRPFPDEGPIADDRPGLGVSPLLVALPDGGGLLNGTLRYEPRLERWRSFPIDLANLGYAFASGKDGEAHTVAPDGRGGAWIGWRYGSSSGADDLLHYTDSPPVEVFTEAPSPLPRATEELTDLVGQPDGTLWAPTSEGSLYRYARSTGWDRVAIPGWRAARATVAQPAFAVAVDDDGVGVAVGREGRIADIAGDQVALNPAAGTICDLAQPIAEQIPCGTSRNLRAAAVSPQGAAIVGGEGLALLWRPPGGGFRAIERPEAALSAEITGLALPREGLAYLTTDQGQIFRGIADGAGGWSWTLESVDTKGTLLTADPTSARDPAALHALAVDAAGHGYAVGERGVVLERSGGSGCGPSAQPCWRLLRSGVSYILTAVALRGEHVLIGGAEGLVLSGSGERLAVARAPGQEGGGTGDVVGLALSGGVAEGQVEAWAATDGPQRRRLSGERTGRHRSIAQLFHYASHPSEPLLDPQRSAAGPLADSPAHRGGETAFAALGKLDCEIVHAVCPLLDDRVGSEHAVRARRSVEAIAARAQQPNGPALALWTGDLADEAGTSAANLVNPIPNDVADAVQSALLDIFNPVPRDPAGDIGATKLRTHARWLAEPLARGGVGFYAAIGSQDLATSQVCQRDHTQSCLPTQELARPGLNDAWRTALADAAPPWGRGGVPALERYEVRPLGRSGGELRLPDPTVEAGGHEREVKVVAGGARTHYAFDLADRDSGRKLVRFAFADNSLRSLQAADPIQHPTELETNESGSGQAGWLRRVLCTKGEGSRCSREPGQPAVVVANAPTYSYASGDPRFWAKDAALFESILLQNRATSVISGSLGWNGRYWAVGAGAHVPCQGEPYQDSPPRPGELSCRGRSSEELPLGAGGVAPIANQLAGSLSAAGPVIEQASDEVNAVAGSGLLPFVVASGAGGKLSGQEASQGFFHGYSIVRVPGNADPAGVLVEQRPLFDFVQITAASHVLRPGQKMTLRGVGRGPLAYSSGPPNPYAGHRVASFDPIDSAAITHRYDLVEADPAQPWLPRKPYVPLDPSVATVDSATGVIKVGKGNYPRTFALGMLSVGCSGTQADADGTCDSDDPGVKVATFPLVFEPRRTFKPVVVVQPRVAQIKARAQAALPQPPNPPQPPAVKGVELPAPPGVPVPPPVNVPNVNPPAPPIPPPPPVGQSPVPLDLTASAPSVTIAPQTTVIPPPAPPIQPAPPGGARREARQRQSATQSSGSGSGQSEGGIDKLGGDLAQDRPSGDGSAMTRVDRSRADGGSMTAYYGASVTLLALVMAAGWNYGRPGPRRRSPYEPAPARAWARRR